MTDFNPAKIERMARSAASAAKLRHAARAAVINNGTPAERLALDLAVKGYGVEDVKVKAGVDLHLARLLVLGTMAPTTREPS
jgi:hypothetical protein